MFSKMLVDKNYSIGKRMELIVSYFQEINSQKDKKMSHLLWLNQAISEITDEILEGFNCSRK